MSLTKPHRSLLAAVSAAALFTACGANENILKSGKETPAPSSSSPTQVQVSSFASDLEAMRTAGFTSIYVLRRRDGQVFDSEDRALIRQNTAGANRRVASDNDRAILIGSNFQLPPENLKVIFDRFAVDDQSPPPTTAETGKNSKN